MCSSSLSFKPTGVKDPGETIHSENSSIAFFCMDNLKRADLSTSFFSAKFLNTSSQASCDQYISTADQAYAWLVQSFKSGHGVGSIAEEARRIAREYVRIFTAVELNDLQGKWEKDSFVSSIIREEKSRRLQGGTIYSKSYMTKYFSRSTYELNNINYDSQDLEVDRSEEISAENTVLENGSEIKVGALLPITGQYATHAKKVEDGIRLALRESGLENNLIVYDSNIDLINTYNKLANEDKVRIIFGPMLVKDVEVLA